MQDIGTARDRAPRLSHCGSCGAPIFWALTARDKRMPMLPTPDERGEWVIDGWHPDTRAPLVRRREPLLDGHKLRFTPHWATCPNSDQHRKRTA